MSEPRFRVGDLIRVIEYGCGHNYALEEVYKIIVVGAHGDGRNQHIYRAANAAFLGNFLREYQIVGVCKLKHGL